MSSARSFLLLSLACAALASLLFFPGLSGYFVFDDGPNIVHNQAIQITTLDANSLLKAAGGFQAGGGSRALAEITFALDYWRGGLDPRVFKTTNVAIHALTTIALAWLFRALLLLQAWPPKRASLAALALALAWALHPLQASSVLYVVQRMQTLGTLFLVLALLAYLKARQIQIEGGRSRPWWLMALLSWGLAFASKEDSILLPAYTLALELTVLRFGAAQPALARTLRRSYLTLVVAGTALYLLVVVPYFWHWEAYPARDYSSIERLLTQGRVLIMYLGQILLPLPQNMPFYYDWFEPSRNLLLPWTTLPSVLLIAGLLAVAWKVRSLRPLFSLGVFIFFAGHFMSSNVIGLELAFEHRNHFPLIGIVLAFGDLLVLALQRFKVRPLVGLSIAALLLIALGSATFVRTSLWGAPMELAQKSTEYAPRSARAWNSLCITNFELSERNPDSPYLVKAIEACSEGSKMPYAVSSLTNLVVFKTIRGEATQADWNRLHDRLRHVTMSPENSGSIWVILNNARQDTPLDQDAVIEVIDIVTSRTQLKPLEYAAIGYFVLGRTEQPDKAYAFFAEAVKNAPGGSMLVRELVVDLKERGKHDWAERLDDLARGDDAQATGKGPQPN